MEICISSRVALYSIVLPMIVLATRPIVSAGEGNLLQNPSFEEGDGRGPENWHTLSPGGVGAVFTWDHTRSTGSIELMAKIHHILPELRKQLLNCLLMGDTIQ